MKTIMADGMRVAVLEMEVDVCELGDVESLILRWVTDAGIEKRGRYVCVSNVHMCMETVDCPEFRRVVNSADLVVADGKPIHLAQRVLGFPRATQVRGMDLTLAACRRAAEEQVPVGFYGGDAETLASMIASLKGICPNLNVVYAYSPPFRPLTPAEDYRVTVEICSSGARLLFVGLGCPKQERWMFEHRDRLPCVMLGVGAAFDFIAGKKGHAPKWMRGLALEWLYRLISEPGRLWRRYLFNNPRFLVLFGLQYIKSLVSR